MDDDGPLLNVTEVAEHVGLSHDAVRRAVRAGQLEASKLGGRIRVRPSAVERWINEGRVTPAEVKTPSLRSLPPAKSTRRFRDRVKG